MFCKNKNLIWSEYGDEFAELLHAFDDKNLGDMKSDQKGTDQNTQHSGNR